MNSTRAVNCLDTLTSGREVWLDDQWLATMTLAFHSGLTIRLIHSCGCPDRHTIDTPATLRALSSQKCTRCLLLHLSRKES